MSEPNLSEQLADAEAMVLRLKERIEGATCAEAGHVWKHIGGKNADCGEDGCGCSVPVHTCERCGDCDYGDNTWASEARDNCRRFGQ